MPQASSEGLAAAVRPAGLSQVRPLEVCPPWPSHTVAGGNDPDHVGSGLLSRGACGPHLDAGSTMVDSMSFDAGHADDSAISPGRPRKGSGSSMTDSGSAGMTREQVLNALAAVAEPATGRGLVDLKLVTGVTVDGRDVRVGVDLL